MKTIILLKKIYFRILYLILFITFLLFILYSFFKSLRNKELSNFILPSNNIFYFYDVYIVDTKPRMNNSLILILILNFS